MFWKVESRKTYGCNLADLSKLKNWGNKATYIIAFPNGNFGNKGECSPKNREIICESV